MGGVYHPLLEHGFILIQNVNNYTYANMPINILKYCQNTRIFFFSNKNFKNQKIIYYYVAI